MSTSFPGLRKCMTGLPGRKKVAVITRWPYYRGDRITEVAVLPRWPYYRGDRITEVTVLPRWPYYRGGRITEVTVLPRWPYYWGGRKAGFHCTTNWNWTSLQWRRSFWASESRFFMFVKPWLPWRLQERKQACSQRMQIKSAHTWYISVKKCFHLSWVLIASLPKTQSCIKIDSNRT